MSRSYLIMVGGDLLLAISIFVVGNLLLIGSVISPEVFALFDPVVLGVMCLSLLIAKYSLRLYRFYKSDRREFHKSFIRIATASLLPVTIIVYYAINPDVSFPPGVLETTLISFCLIQLLIFYRFYVDDNAGKNRENVLILGAGPMAMQVTDVIADSAGKFDFFGYIQPEKTDEAEKIENPATTADKLLQTVKDKNITKIVVALSERRGVLPTREMFSCKLRGVEVIDAISFYERETGKILLEHTRPGWFVFSKGFQVTRLMLLKQRIFDIISASILLLITLPIFPFIALAIRLESPGEVFFRQKRVGFKEELFDVIKFRTMCANAEKDSGAVWAQENDSRVTRLGAILRKCRIDELPQMFNVLKGEMSFIGPRPERPEFVSRLSEKIPYYSRRHSVRPGLTGWAQIKYPYGASEEDAMEKLRYDLYYIKNFSFFLEMKIIFGTISVVLFGKGGR